MDAAGLIKALTPGTTYITASKGELTSNKHKIDVLALSPSPAGDFRIEVGTRSDYNILSYAVIGYKIQLRSIAVLEGGRLIDITSAVKWSTGDKAVASVSKTGLLTVHGGTKTSVTAEYPATKKKDGTPIASITKKIEMKLESPPENQTAALRIFGVDIMHKDLPHQFNSTLMYNGKITLINQYSIDATNNSVWTSADPAIASVDKNSGVVTGHKAGNVVIIDKYSMAGSTKVLTATHSIEITDEKITGIELQTLYTEDGSGLRLSGQTQNIPVLQPGYFAKPPLNALFMALYVKYANGEYEYVPSGASWLSSDQSSAYTAADQSTAYVYGLKSAKNVKITASYKGFKTSFLVNVIKTPLPKLTSVKVMNLNNHQIIGTNGSGDSVDDPNGFNFVNEDYKIPVLVLGTFDDGKIRDITAQANFISEKNNDITLLPTYSPGKTLISVARENAVVTMIKLDLSDYTLGTKAGWTLFDGVVGFGWR